MWVERRTREWVMAGTPEWAMERPFRRGKWAAHRKPKLSASDERRANRPQTTRGYNDGSDDGTGIRPDYLGDRWGAQQRALRGQASDDQHRARGNRRASRHVDVR